MGHIVQQAPQHNPAEIDSLMLLQITPASLCAVTGSIQRAMNRSCIMLMCLPPGSPRAVQVSSS